VLLGIAGLIAAANGDDRKAPPVAGKAAEKHVTFQMQAAPWKKVFEWLADQTGLPVVANTVPTGTFTFVPPATGKAARTYTIPEVIDLVNDSLILKQHILVRRPNSLQLVPADERFDAALAPLINPDTMSGRARTEVVHMILPLSGIEAKEALTAVKSLLGPFGQAQPVGNRLLVRDTVGNLRKVIRLVHELGVAADTGAVGYDYKCSHIKASEARRILDELLGDTSRTRGGRKFSIAVDQRTNTVHLHGPAERVAQARSILAKIDVADSSKQPVATDPPILKAHSVPAGHADALARTLQEQYRKSPGVKITAVGGNILLVYAAPDVQFAIARDVMGAMPAAAIEVIPLTALDAARALETLRAMFSGARGSRATLLADTTRNALIVRGSRDQVDEVKSALKALGETGAPASGVRIITLERGDAATLAEEIQRLLQKMRPNPVSVIAPGAKSAPAAKPPAGGKSGPAAKKEMGKPVTLTALGNKLVVACDDPQVLTLVQELVRLVTAPQQSGPEVIRLQHATAVDAARILDEVFNGRPGPGTTPRPTRVQIVAEPITNALLIKASPLDLLTIRRLLAQTLDVAADRGDSGTQTYVLGPFRHATPADIAKVLRDLYRDSKPPVTIAVDPRTGSVLLRGPAAVYHDARKLIIQLDVKVDKK
jgi:type II secretory pathway component GspD/PulD (secretin)